MLLFLVLLAIQPAFAARNVIFPFKETFSRNNYGDAVWLANGAGLIHIASGGWRDGAVRIIPPNRATGGNGTYAGMGSYYFPPSPVVHLRFLVKFGPEYIRTARPGIGNMQNKFAIFTSESIHTRGILSLFQTPEQDYSLGVCENSRCRYECGQGSSPSAGDWWPNGRDAFLLSRHLNEWIAIEYAVNLRTGRTSLYIWTINGHLNGLYKEYYITRGGTLNVLQILGGYYNGYHIPNAGSYVMFDEIALDSKYIGPPPGFVAKPVSLPVSILLLKEATSQ